jgi:Leucine-rich repeat (LRR) protein
VLQNSETELDAETLCSLLCSSKAVRTAAQQAGGPCSDIYIEGDVAQWAVVSRMASFAKWLPAHANLIGELAFELLPWGSDEYAVDAYSVLDTMLGFSAQQIAAAPTTSSSSSSSSSAAAAAAGEQQQQQQQRRPDFALRSFDSTIRHSADVLSALSAATLTDLTFIPKVVYQSERPPAPLANALARLTNLRHLDLHDRLTGAWLPIVGKLTQLTSFEICELDACFGELRSLPASLERLSMPNFYVCYDDDEDDEGDAGAEGVAEAEGAAGGGGVEGSGNNGSRDSQDDRHLDLRHLTRLTDLTLYLYDTDQAQSDISGQLPAQLLELNAARSDGGVLPLLGFETLQQLQRLTLPSCKESRGDLLALNSLTALTDVELAYSGRLREIDTASVWSELPQLRSLCVTSSSHPDDVEDDGAGFRRVMHGIAAATSLRQLHLHVRNGISARAMRSKLCGYLTGLQQLQELRVSAPQLSAADDDLFDAMHLTALTSLTRLDVSSWRSCDVATVALACNLSQLRELKLVDCGIESKAVLPAIAKLVQLQHLDLSYNALGCDSCLQLLTQLRALTALGLISLDGEAPSKAALDAFWAAVRGPRNAQQ